MDPRLEGGDNPTKGREKISKFYPFGLSAVVAVMVLVVHWAMLAPEVVETVMGPIVGNFAVVGLCKCRTGPFMVNPLMAIFTGDGAETAL